MKDEDLTIVVRSGVRSGKTTKLREMAEVARKEGYVVEEVQPNRNQKRDPLPMPTIHSVDFKRRR